MQNEEQGKNTIWSFESFKNWFPKINNYKCDSRKHIKLKAENELNKIKEIEKNCRQRKIILQNE